MELPDNIKPVICIAGPTASGKSGAAVRLAKAIDGEIINVDSMQVYADLQVLSARPDDIEQDGVPHHLFGHIDGRVRYSTGQWVRDSTEVILDCLARHKTPILVGGTGLYFSALFEGIAEVPTPDEEVLERVGKLAATDVKTLREQALQLDPTATTRVLGDDAQRLVRIVSVALGTDRILSEWQKDTQPVVPKKLARRFVILPDRSALYSRINSRFDLMLENGAVQEVATLREKGLDANLPVVKAIGVPHLSKFLNGDVSLTEASELSKRDTRRYAKRQYTWFRNRHADWTILNDASEMPSAMHEI